MLRLKEIPIHNTLLSLLVIYYMYSTKYKLFFKIIIRPIISQSGAEKNSFTTTNSISLFRLNSVKMSNNKILLVFKQTLIKQFNRNKQSIKVMI